MRFSYGLSTHGDDGNGGEGGGGEGSGGLGDGGQRVAQRFLHAMISGWLGLGSLNQLPPRAWHLVWQVQ